MSRPRTIHRCRLCGSTTARWAGRCPSCGEWNSLAEEPLAHRSELSRAPAGAAASNVRWLHVPGASPTEQAVALSAVDLDAAGPDPTGLAELDRVLGGGLVPGSVTLVGGEPGVGKSTLVLQVLRARATMGAPVLLVCAEESARQVRLRAERLGPLPEGVTLLPTTDVSAVPAALVDCGAELAVVDSVQAVRDPVTTGAAGSVAQVRACAELLVGVAKHSGVPVVLVGHVTKDGSLAGPRHLEHAVDTVLSVEGDRHHALRAVRAVKHRFGPTGELGLFEMLEAGLAAVTDPYRLLLGDRRPGQAGSTVLPAVEGQRSLLVEVQALVAPAASPTAGPRRQAQGVDAGRLSMLLAVLDRAGVALRARDVFVSVVGGVRVAEPAADLAVVLSLASAARHRAPPADVVAFGEVGLGGEVRQVAHAPRRLAEAARLGFRYALVPASCPDGPPGMRLLRVHDVSEVARLLDG